MVPSLATDAWVLAVQVIYKVRKGIDCDIGLQSFFISPGNGDVCQSAAACPDVPANWGPIDSHNSSEYIPYTCCIDFSYPFFTGGWALMSKVCEFFSTAAYLYGPFNFTAEYR